jgi:transposase
MTEFELVIVDKPADQKDQKGFVVQPKRWIVERTFAWICKYRRLVRDYEYLTRVSAANLYGAMTHRMLNWLTRAEQTT